jgi:uncharacterized protein (TIGR02145 family)
MKKRVLKNVLWLLLIFAANQAIAQVKVGDNPTSINSTAIFEMESINKGILFPRMTTTQRNAITSPATGLLIYNTTTSKIEVNVSITSTANWQELGSGLGNGAAAGNTPYWNGTNWVLNSSNIFNNGGNVGIGTTAPASGLDIKTSMGLNVTTITSATILNQTHNVVLCNTGPYIVTLPAASSNAGKVYYIKNISSTNVTITLDGNASETIDGSTTYLLDLYKHAIRIICDGSNWHVLEETGSQLTSSTFTYSNCDGSNMAIVDVLNPATGKIWMDRNLGASRVATSSRDASSYGELYQWGRLKDGHQCRNSTTTTTLSSTDVPGHANYITINTTPNDWRNAQNSNLWQGVNGINNPCPTGYRLPTSTEWTNEVNSWGTWPREASAFSSLLKLPVAGLRDRSTGNITSNIGNYWSTAKFVYQTCGN